MSIVPAGQRYARQEIYDFRYVLHDLHVNAWSLAWRRLLGERLLTWRGEQKLEPPKTIDQSLLSGVKGLKDAKLKKVWPDDVLEVARRDGKGRRTFFLELDRTRRVERNLTKFRRYDTFACLWWTTTIYGREDSPPWVVFICQDDEQRRLFLDHADRELTGHIWGPSVPPDSYEYVGRDRALFVSERDIHSGSCVGYRVPTFPPSIRTEKRSSEPFYSPVSRARGRRSRAWCISIQ